MQERVLALKGNFTIDTEPGYGCQIVVNLPLEQQTNWEQPTAEEDISLENADTIPPVNTATTEFSLENADTILPEEASTIDFNLENADTILPEETSTIDFNLINDDTTPLEEISAIEFNLKLIDTTLIQNTSLQNFNLTLLETTPLAETIAPDYNSKLLDETPLEIERQSLDLEQKTMFLSQETIAETESNPDNLPNDNEFISQFGQDLAELVGPIAYYLVQKVLQSSPGISHLELIKTVLCILLLINKLRLSSNQAFSKANLQIKLKLNQHQRMYLLVHRV